MREILNPWCSGDLSDLATHSAKATILSWMSKANVSVSLRRLAGYHIKPGDKSALEYSRDAAAPILREIEGILIAIKAGYFRPDEARSKRWYGCNSIHEAVRLSAEFGRRVVAGKKVQPLGSTEVADPHNTEEEHDSWEFIQQEEAFLKGLHSETHDLEGRDDCGEECSDNTPIERLRPQTSGSHKVLSEKNSSESSGDQSSSSSSLDSDSLSTDRERRAAIDGEANARDLVPPSDIAGKICFRHKKSCKLHVVKSDSHGVMTFYCGRKAGPNHIRLDEAPAFDGNGCLVCFNYTSGPVNDSD